MVAQFSVKTTNSKKAIEFLSLMSCSIHKLKSLPCYSRSKIVYFRFYVKKNFVPGNGAPPAGWLLLPPPLSMALRYKVYLGKLFFFCFFFIFFLFFSSGMTVLSSAVFHLPCLSFLCSGDKKLLSDILRKWGWFLGHNERFPNIFAEN